MAQASTWDGVVIGAGPAGLAAAEVLSATGASVLVAEARPSLGRKFLMAGKSGLNLTMDQPAAAFRAVYECAELAPMLTAFGPLEVQAWARGLGQEVFTGTSARVFPRAMKASPLLRAWRARLLDQGVSLATRWRWQGWAGEDLRFDTQDGPRTLNPPVTILALGGASWARLGSDGAWTAHLPGQTTPFAPANMGLRLAWSERLRALAGAPLKPVALRLGARQVRGECVLSATGLEGSAVYALSRVARRALAHEPATLWLDLAPDRAHDALARALARANPKHSLSNRLRKAARLDAPKRALLFEPGPPPPEPMALAQRIKALPLQVTGTAPLDQAISVAGGLRWDALTPELELRARPGTFVCGEMLDWEAPTGGYLLTACFATGRWAGQAAARRLG